MATYSTSLKLTLLADGEQSGVWGQTQNTNLGTLLEQAITGVTSITMTDANYTLTNFNGASDEARNAVLVVGGTNNAVRDIIAPLVEKLYTVYNATTGGYGIRIKGASGTAVTVPNGVTTLVYCDGTNFYAGLSGVSGSFYISGNATATGNLSCGNVTTANINGTTATFSGAISSVSPSFTGTPLAVTAANGTSTTQIATTAFVQNATTNLGLGTMSTQNANNVAITGGTISGLGTPLAVASGGSGRSTLTANNLIAGNGTSAVNLIAPGASGNVLASNGTTWASSTNYSLGVGQSWQNVTSSRSAGTTYTNSTGYPICVYFITSFAAQNDIVAYVDSQIVYEWGISGNYAIVIGVNFIVPNGSTYSATIPGGFQLWKELR